MHHTDYNRNLRKAQHKTHKKLTLNQSERVWEEKRQHQLIPAAIAALLVVIALLQMDPANAQHTTMNLSSPAPPTELALPL